MYKFELMADTFQRALDVAEAARDRMGPMDCIVALPTKEPGYLYIVGMDGYRIHRTKIKMRDWSGTEEAFTLPYHKGPRKGAVAVYVTDDRITYEYGVGTTYTFPRGEVPSEAKTAMKLFTEPESAPVRVNPRYLKDFTAVCPKTGYVQLYPDDGTKPIYMVSNTGDAEALIMPVRAKKK